ncbi:MAG: phasin family protein [Alphaproteobacteria bacterium]|nr:phasin family protein [Alphaproteobacteria bacterium]
MMKSFEDLQAMNKDGIEAFAASSAALTKGYQAVAQEVADYSKKSFEKSATVWQNAVSAKSFEKAVEVQQAYAKESFDAAVAEFTKLGEMVAAATKSAFKPYEATFAAFGVKAPVAK